MIFVGVVVRTETGNGLPETSLGCGGSVVLYAVVGSLTATHFLYLSSDSARSITRHQFTAHIHWVLVFPLWLYISPTIATWSPGPSARHLAWHRGQQPVQMYYKLASLHFDG